MDFNRLTIKSQEAIGSRSGLNLELTDAAKEQLAETGWDPTYGASAEARDPRRCMRA